MQCSDFGVPPDYEWESQLDGSIDYAAADWQILKTVAIKRTGDEINTTEEQCAFETRV